MKTITFKISGLTGFLLKDDAIQDYSLVSIGMKVPQASGMPNEPAILFIEAVFLTFGLVMPLLFLLSSLILWYAPLSHSQWASRMLVTTECLNAWSALDVFIVSVAAALMQIRQFASFIVGENCDGINAILKDYMNEEMKGQNKCFDVEAGMGFSSWGLFLSALLLNVVAVVTLRAAEQALHKGGALVEEENVSAFKDDVHYTKRPTVRLSTLYTGSPHPPPPPPPPPPPLPPSQGGKVRRGRVSVYQNGQIVAVAETHESVVKEKKDDSEKSWKLFPKWLQISGMFLRLLLWLNMIKVKQGNGEIVPVDYRSIKWYLTHALDAIAAYICRVPLPAAPKSKAQTAFEAWDKQYHGQGHHHQLGAPVANVRANVLSHHHGHMNTLEANIPQQDFNSSLDENTRSL
jgi:hypothetical protein